MDEAKAAALTAKVDNLRTRVERLHESLRTLRKRDAERQAHAVAMAEAVLPLRLAALRRDSAKQAAAQVRAADFMTRSASYRETVRDADSRVSGCVGPVDASGLRFWIPPQRAVDGKPDLAARTAAGHLPLKEILGRRVLAVGTVMLDIGANIGTTSIPRAALGDFQQIYAAEPEPANFACLVQNTIANGLEGIVLPDRVAIGASNGDMRFALMPRIGGHRLATAGDLERDAETVAVPCRTLDAWIMSLGIDPHAIAFIKCDVQGWEPQVLAGAPDTLAKRHIVWELEVSPKHLTEAGSSLAALCGLISRSFDRFIDLRASDMLARPTAEIETSLGDVAADRRYTNLLVYNVA